MTAPLTKHPTNKSSSQNTAIAPIASFIAVWTMDEMHNMSTYRYINDGPGACSWPLRRKLLTRPQETTGKQDDESGEGGWIGRSKQVFCDSDDGDDGSQTIRPDDDDDGSSCTLMDGEPEPTRGRPANTVTPSFTSIERWLDNHSPPSQRNGCSRPAVRDEPFAKHYEKTTKSYPQGNTDWAQEAYDLLSHPYSQPHHKHHVDQHGRECNVHGTQSPTCNPAKGVIMVKVAERGITWDLDENKKLVWLQEEDAAMYRTDYNGLALQRHQAVKFRVKVRGFRGHGGEARFRIRSICVVGK